MRFRSWLCIFFSSGSERYQW